MKPQTADNLRCLAAALFVFGALGVFLAFPRQTEWFLSLPGWLHTAGLLALLLLTVRLLNWRRTVKTERVLFDNLMITNASADGETQSVINLLCVMEAIALMTASLLNPGSYWRRINNSLTPCAPPEMAQRLFAPNRIQ